MAVTLHDPSNNLALIKGVVFRASYLGSTQLSTGQYQQHAHGQSSKAIRMMQAQEAVGRIKVNTEHDNPLPPM